MKTIILLLSSIFILLVGGCTKYPEGDINKPKFSKDEAVDLNTGHYGITLPGTGYTAPLKITSMYWDKMYQTWSYNATDARPHQYEHFLEYQLKKHKGN